MARLVFKAHVSGEGNGNSAQSMRVSGECPLLPLVLSSCLQVGAVQGQEQGFLLWCKESCRRLVGCCGR